MKTKLVASSNTCYLLVGGKSNSVSFLLSSFLLLFLHKEKDRPHTTHPTNQKIGIVIDKMTGAYHLPSYYSSVDVGTRVKGCWLPN